MNNFQELFRMNYSGATCIVNYTEPYSVKVRYTCTEKVQYTIVCPMHLRR